MWRESRLQEAEGKQLEFKQDLSSPKGLLKTLVAFANSAGGLLVLGVRDDRTVVGVAQPFDEEERLASLVADSIAPRLVPDIEMTTVGDKTLLLVQVYPSSRRPHHVRKEGPEAGVYVRLGSTNRRADAPLIAELQRSAGSESYDEGALPALAPSALDLDAAAALFGASRTLTDEALLSLRVLTPHQGRLVPTRGGVLLFGRARTAQFPDAWVQCGRFRGRDKRDIFDHFDLLAPPLPTLVDEVLFFLKKHAFRAADLSEVRRKDVWSIPLAILREVVINALVHADYAQRGAPLRVAFFDDRIEVENPGILVPGLTIDDMKAGISKIRNPVLARVFHELGLVERWGSGVQRIFAEAAAQGLPAPTVEEIGMRLRFRVYLRQAIEIPASSLAPAAEQVTGPGPESGLESGLESESEEKVLLALADATLSRARIAEKLGHARISGAVNRALHALLQRNLIAYTRPDKPNSRLQEYRLSAQGARLARALQRRKETE